VKFVEKAGLELESIREIWEWSEFESGLCFQFHFWHFNF